MELWNGGVGMVNHTLHLHLKIPQPCDILKSWTDEGVTPTHTYPRLEDIKCQVQPQLKLRLARLG